MHPHASCTVSFIRTLRIPDDDREYPLPPGFSKFPLQHVDDYASRLPESWSTHGGVFLPMYQAEAMWLSFSGRYPMALKIATGKTCALTGEPWHDRLTPARRVTGGMPRLSELGDPLGVSVPEDSPQDYVVVPDQPWLDGFYAGKGLIRQFVAMPLGEGYTSEEQLTGKPEHGGLQIAAYPMKAEELERWIKNRDRRLRESSGEATVVYCASPMGLAPGGRMRQEIYEDRFGIGVWDQAAESRCFVHILNSAQHFQVTQQEPPTKPPTAKDYAAAGLPWFDYYDAELKALESLSKLLGLKSIAELMIKKGVDVLPDNATLAPGKVVHLSKQRSVVREGEF